MKPINHEPGTCPNCGHFDWSSAPTLRAIRDFIVKRNAVRLRELQEEFGLKPNAAANHVARLVRMGLVTRSEAMSDVGSPGVYRLFIAVTPKKGKAKP